MTDNDQEDAPMHLSSHALLALQEFLREQQEQQDRFEKLRARAEQSFDHRSTAEAPPHKVVEQQQQDTPQEDTQISMDLFREDFQLSQFWYTEETARVLAVECLRHAKKRVACISAPSTFAQLYTLRNQYPHLEQLVLLEYDTRFSVYGPTHFLRYDYQRPLEQLPSAWHASFDVIMVDPPFLSEECLRKSSQTVHWLCSKDAKIVLCTGQVMKELAWECLRVQPVRFHPEHASGLSNEFACYTNYSGQGEFSWTCDREIGSPIGK